MARGIENEKITINLGSIGLGRIDVFVLEDIYAHQSDFICTVIRKQADRHSGITRQLLVRKKVELGLRRCDRAELEAAQAKGERLDICVFGLAVLADDVPPELTRATINSIEVLGSLQASAAVKHGLDEKLR